MPRMPDDLERQVEETIRRRAHSDGISTYDEDAYERYARMMRPTVREEILHPRAAAQREKEFLDRWRPLFEPSRRRTRSLADRALAVALVALACAAIALNIALNR